MQQAVALFDTHALRAMEAAAVATAGEGVLMQRAGEAAWRHLLDTWPDAQRILVICGPGNNGGDGYALATHAITSGRHVDLIRMSEPRTHDAAAACHAFLAAGGHCRRFDGSLPATDVVVDALFGIGLNRAPDPESSRLIDAINAHAAGVLSIDVPSGVDADSGHVPGVAISADTTVQFIAAHRGLATGAALDHCGNKVVARIGVGSDGHA
ncbi:MAG TPA: NAD(P)H-hydrate epimerase, partial [Luteimonas sp.]|nr:NAD(P)H-hydrate epimerase [Luteimonas sp.]